MNNEILYILLLIVFVYVIAVIVILMRKSNKEEKPKTEHIAMIKCMVCGNKIPFNVKECPYCHCIINGG